jgi:arabinofuranan 3-O-arabinosyltransferase
MRAREVPEVTVAQAPMTRDSPVERELTVPSPSEEQVVAVRENQSSGWVASVPGDGTARRMTVDGWQQGWQLDGHVERVKLSFAPDLLYRSSLAVGGVLLLLLAMAALWLRRRPGSQAALGSRAIRPWVLAAGGLLALGVLAGWAGLACGAGAVGAAAFLRRRAPDELATWMSGLLVAAAAVFYWLRPLGSADGWAGTLPAPQLLVAGALGLLLSTDLVLAGHHWRSFRRIAGRSTTR